MVPQSKTPVEDGRFVWQAPFYGPYTVSGSQVISCGHM